MNALPSDEGRDYFRIKRQTNDQYERVRVRKEKSWDKLSRDQNPEGWRMWNLWGNVDGKYYKSRIKMKDEEEEEEKEQEQEVEEEFKKLFRYVMNWEMLIRFFFGVSFHRHTG